MRSSFNCRNTTQQVDPASQTGTANGVQAPARKMTRVEVERMLTEYVRDATPGELRAEAKEKMLDCYDRINRSSAETGFRSALQALHLKAPETSPLTLGLNSFGLRKLPDNLSFLNGVKEICLAYNHLEELPESIGSIRTLESIDLRHNAIKTLPDSFGSLVELNELKASKNRLESLPGSFCQLSNLTNLSLSGNLFEVFPGTISQLLKLTTLHVSNNQLHLLPESIGSLVCLVKLDLSDNQIRELPQAIGSMSALNALKVHCNQLQTLPASIGLLRNLKRLEIAVNQLQTLPESIGDLQSLLTFNLNANLITELPESIVRLPTDCAVQLNMDSLSQTVRNQLNHAIVAHHAQHPEQGPRIEFNMAAFNQVFDLKPLPEEINSWRAEGKLSATSDEPQQFQTAIEQLTNLESEAFSKQLGRMRLTAHYAKAPADLVPRVNAILNYIQEKPDVLQTCAAIAAEGTETCDDRIALAFIELEEAIINHQSLNEPSLSKLLHTASSLHKSQLLKNIAQEKVSNLRGLVDPTEIILKYMVKLSREFNLPSKLNDMIFHNCARQVSDEDIQIAREKIREQSTDENLDTFLATWHPWQQALNKQHSTEYAQVQAEVKKQQVNMHEKMDKLTDRLTATKTRHGELSTQYLDLIAKSNALRADYRNIETTGLAKLTQEIRQVTSKSETP